MSYGILVTSLLGVDAALGSGQCDIVGPSGLYYTQQYVIRFTCVGDESSADLTVTFTLTITFEDVGEQGVQGSLFDGFKLVQARMLMAH